MADIPQTKRLPKVQAQQPKASQAALKRLVDAARGRNGPNDSINEVQGLLLQVSFAIMMVFMIAYFLFRTQSSREAEEKILELERQKLVAAVENVYREYETRYGLTQLRTIDERGKVSYRTGECVEEGRLTQVPQLREAFCGGSAHAFEDYNDVLLLRRQWVEKALAEAQLQERALKPENSSWLGEAVDSRIDRLHTQVRNVQLLNAAILQEWWASNPDTIDDPSLSRLLDRFQKGTEAERMLIASDVAESLRSHCITFLEREAGTPMLKN